MSPRRSRPGQRPRLDLRRRLPVLALLLVMACSTAKVGSKPCTVELATVPEGAVAYLVPYDDWLVAVGDGSLEDALARHPGFLLPHRVPTRATPVTLSVFPYSYVFVADLEGRRAHSGRFTARHGERVEVHLPPAGTDS